MAHRSPSKWWAVGFGIVAATCSVGGTVASLAVTRAFGAEDHQKIQTLEHDVSKLQSGSAANDADHRHILRSLDRLEAWAGTKPKGEPP